MAMPSMTEMRDSGGAPFPQKAGASTPAGPAASPEVMQQQTQEANRPKRPGGAKPDPEGSRRGLTQAINNASAALHKNRKTSDAILNMVSKQEKVGSVAKAAVQMVSMLDKKAPIPKRTLAPLTIFSALEIVTLTEESGKMTFSNEEKAQITVTAVELLLEGVGVSREEAQALAEQAGPKGRKQMEQGYEELRNA